MTSRDTMDNKNNLQHFQKQTVVVFFLHATGEYLADTLAFKDHIIYKVVDS